jgi:hypothetical protein
MTAEEVDQLFVNAEEIFRAAGRKGFPRRRET